MKPQLLALLGALATGLLLMAGTGTAEAKATRGPTLSLDVPSSVNGSFDVTVVLAGATEGWRAFNVQLQFDPDLLRVVDAGYGGVLGPESDVYCVRVIDTPGKATFACTLLGPDTVAANGSVATFRFEVVSRGKATLHLTTFDEGGSNDGSFLVSGEHEPLETATRDATISVNP